MEPIIIGNLELTILRNIVTPILTPMGILFTNKFNHDYMGINYAGTEVELFDAKLRGGLPERVILGTDYNIKFYFSGGILGTLTVKRNLDGRTTLVLE